MPAANQVALQFLDIERIMDRRPLTVDPETTVAVVVDLMCRAVGQTCQLSETTPNLSQPEPKGYFNCALIVAENQLLGIFTERDLVRLVVEGIDLETVAISEVMTQSVVTLEHAKADNIFTVIATLKRHRIRQLPVVNGAGELLGIITQTNIRRAMQPFSFLKLRRVGDVMTQGVVKAKATETLLGLARQMTQHQVSCIVITEVNRSGGLVIEVPIGIVTERDIVQFRALRLSLAQTSAEVVMSTPLFLFVHRIRSGQLISKCSIGIPAAWLSPTKLAGWQVL